MRRGEPMVGKADQFSYFRKNLAFMIGNFPNSKFIQCTALFEIKMTKKNIGRNPIEKNRIEKN